MAPRMICDRITPLLPRAPMSAACEMAAHNSCSDRSSGTLASVSSIAPHGQREIGAGVAIGYRVDVQVVDLLFALFQGLKAGRQKRPGLGDREQRSVAAIRQP